MEERKTRIPLVFAVLAVVWVAVCIWQMLEHQRVREASRETLRENARGISYSLAEVIRSQERGGRILEERLEAALQGLARSDKLLGVALLNASGDVVTSAGEEMEIGGGNLSSSGERWGRTAVTFVNLIDLGNEVQRGSDGSMTIIVPDFGRPPERRDRPPRIRYETVERTSEGVVLRWEFPPEQESDKPEDRGSRFSGRHDDERPEPQLVTTKRDSRGSFTVEFLYSPDLSTSVVATMMNRDDEDRRDDGRREDGRRDDDRGRRGPPPFGRPPGMDRERFEELIAKRGLHGFLLKMSTDQLRAESARDLWLRFAVMGVALVAVGGVGFGWRSMERSARLQMRLVRASEMNAHLREMNLAAAGLAHETRNPLNLVRGFAQMITRSNDAGEEVRQRSREISEEVDRVTARLNEFIDYSKPREPKPAPVDLQSVVRDVERTLESDMSEKNIRFDLKGPDVSVSADESLLRQVLFNLLLNSVQAVDGDGEVTVLTERDGAGEASIEVLDNGPGVPPNAVKEIFRPYYTANKNGTGLGLAVVRQIVLAHGWDIDYIPGEKGARFRISGMKTTAKAY